MARITDHPILKTPTGQLFPFTFDGKTIKALPGETISSALFAAGIRVFGQHPKDDSPQGIFCANGQCSQCMVIADGLPVKACMTPAAPGMVVESMTALPVLPEKSELPAMDETAHLKAILNGNRLMAKLAELSNLTGMKIMWR